MLVIYQESLHDARSTKHKIMALCLSHIGIKNIHINIKASNTLSK